MIRKGQIYESCQPVRPETPGVWGKPAPQARHVRIKVVGNLRASNRVDVVSLVDGKELRRRSIDARQLHESTTTRSGEPRRRGYRLIQDTPGDDR